MLLYSFKCADCHNVFDAPASSKEAEQENFSCPKCQSKNTKHRFSLKKFLGNILAREEKSCGCGMQKRTCSAEKRCGKNGDENHCCK